MRVRKVQLVGLLTLCVSWTLLVPHLSRPLWYDEALTIIEFVTLPSFLEIFSYYPIPNNHIGFNVLLRFWTLALESWFQDPIFLFRLLSFVLSGCVVITIWRVWYRPLGFWPTLIGITAFITSVPFSIYGCAVRGYMLSMWLGVLGLWSAQLIRRGEVRRGGFLFVGLTFLAVWVIPFNIFYFIALMPLFLTQSRGCLKTRLVISSLALSSGIMYLPKMSSMVTFAGRQAGWSSPWQTMEHLYGAVFMACLPMVLVILLGIFLRVRRLASLLKNHSCHTMILFSFMLPLIIILILNPSPYPRVFLIFLPLWYFGSSVWLKTALSWVRLRYPCYRKITAVIILILTVVWSQFVKQNIHIFSSILSPQQEQDDLVAPYYLDEFHPLELAKKIRDVYQTDSNVFVYVSSAADPYSLILAGRMKGLPDTVWLFDKPKKAIEELPPNKSKAFFVVRDKKEILEYQRKFNFTNALLEEDYGYQKLYLMGVEL